MSPVVQRSHDKAIYLREDRFEQPKEIFKLIGESIRERMLAEPGSAVVDLGCATGELIYYLRTRYPSAAYLGCDIVPEFIDVARKRVLGAEFRVGSVLDSGLLAEASADISLLIGVLGIFDQFEPCLSNLLNWTRPGGQILVFGLFNNHPIDVWVRYRQAGASAESPLEAGWNIFSQASVAAFLDSRPEIKGFSFTPFEMPFDILPNPNDPVRTWTFQSNHGRRLFTNGLSLLCNLELLHIRL